MTKLVWQTSDGLTFDNEEEADEHEINVHTKEKVEALISKTIRSHQCDYCFDDETVTKIADLLVMTDITAQVNAILNTV